RRSRESGAPLFMPVLPSLSALLSRLTEEEDLAIGTPVANRARREVEGLIGFFVSNVLLRCDLPLDPALSVLQGRVRQVALAAYAHQDLPFEKVVSALAPERDPSATPVFHGAVVAHNPR